MRRCSSALLGLLGRPAKCRTSGADRPRWPRRCTTTRATANARGPARRRLLGTRSHGILRQRHGARPWRAGQPCAPPPRRARRGRTLRRDRGDNPVRDATTRPARSTPSCSRPDAAAAPDAMTSRAHATPSGAILARQRPGLRAPGRIGTRPATARPRRSRAAPPLATALGGGAARQHAAHGRALDRDQAPTGWGRGRRCRSRSPRQRRIRRRAHDEHRVVGALQQHGAILAEAEVHARAGARRRARRAAPRRAPRSS